MRFEAIILEMPLLNPPRPDDNQAHATSGHATWKQSVSECHSYKTAIVDFPMCLMDPMMKLAR